MPSLDDLKVLHRVHSKVQHLQYSAFWRGSGVMQTYAFGQFSDTVQTHVDRFRTLCLVGTAANIVGDAAEKTSIRVSVSIARPRIL